MKRLFFPVMMCCVLLMTACDDYETYADMKEKERAAISRFLTTEGIKVITEKQFEEQGQTTNVDNKEFVLFSRNGVYMQIVRKGCGNKLEENKTVNVLCRFMEKNIMTDSILVRNDQTWMISTSSTSYYDASMLVDKMSVKRSGTTISGSFVSGVMYQSYGTSTVPSGWLVPLNYVNIGRPDPSTTAEEEVSKVRLIVPHSQGTTTATASVYPCYYEITYVRER